MPFIVIYIYTLSFPNADNNVIFGIICNCKKLPKFVDQISDFMVIM